MAVPSPAPSAAAAARVVDVGASWPGWAVAVSPQHSGWKQGLGVDTEEDQAGSDPVGRHRLNGTEAWLWLSDAGEELPPANS